MQGNTCRSFLPRESDEEFGSTSQYIYHIPEKNLEPRNPRDLESPRALAWTVASRAVARALLRARGILNHVDPEGDSV